MFVCGGGQEGLRDHYNEISMGDGLASKISGNKSRLVTGDWLV
jgi:hypothetical protein